MKLSAARSGAGSSVPPHPEAGKSCPTEILDTLKAFNAEGRPIWKPMHLQPVFRMNDFITASGSGRGACNAYIAGERVYDT